MRLLTIVLFFLLFSATALANKADFDSLYIKTAEDLIISEPEEAIEMVDFLFQSSENDSQRIRALILKADFLMYYGLNEEAQTIFFEAETLAIKTENYISLARIYGYISSLYRETELFSSSLRYLEKAKFEIDKIEEQSFKMRFKGSVELEMANIELDNKNFSKSIQHAREAVRYFKKVEHFSKVDFSYQLTLANGIISENHLRTNELDSSFQYLAKAKNYLVEANFTVSPLEGAIFNGLAQAHQANKDFEKAEENFIAAKRIAEETNSFDLKKDVYKYFSEFYKETGQSEKFIALNEEYNALIEQDEKSRKIVSEKIFNRLYQQQSESEVNKQIDAQIIAGLIALSLSLIILLIWYIYNKKQNQKKFEAYIKELNNKTKSINTATSNPGAVDSTMTIEPKGNQDSNDEKSDPHKRYISEEKENSILESLKELEIAQFYLDDNISLTGLSGKIGVNQRYLTYVIKQHLAPDFATYINELRINYIVDCIKSDPKFLTYKISYLAQYCGFSSHSRFSINFKKVTGTTPSAFINYIKAENEKVNG